GVVRPFTAGWRATWRRSMLLGVALSALLVVLLVDVRMLSPLQAGVVIIPVLGVLAALALATGLVALVAISEAPAARLRDVIKASLYLGARRWYLTAVSMVVLGTQLMLFASMPALAIGLSAAPALYLAWANSRYTLRPVLATDEATAS
ncbi:MAG TPA: ferredoxin-NADPH reductase, partial [Rhodoglobus sp.]|nr:ferredoxin-NADPH reductase [Rhodoglobus sp.]